MKFLPLLWSGIWRKPVRTVPGVKTVSFNYGMLTYYQKPTESVYVLAIPPIDLFRTLDPQAVTVEPEALEALRKTRTGVLITADIGKKYGWHVGDKIPLTSSTLQTSGSATWTFDVVGTVTFRNAEQGSWVFANYYYIDEARALNKGTVGHFYAIVSNPKQAATVSDAIDRAFANSASPTRTASFRELSQQQMQSLGDLNFAIRSILSAVLVALVFSTATMMMQTVRERTPELAVLKTLGFGDRTVFLLIAGESLLVCIAAALAGLALAWSAFPLAAKYIPGLSMPIVVVVFGILGAVLVALISVSAPALRAARLNIVDALAGR